VKSETLRAFIAIKIADGIKENLLSAVGRLGAAGADAKWVERQNIHLTLKFLGNITKEGAGELAKLLRENAKAVNPFEIKVSGVGTFPLKGAPRVVWAGCSNEEILKSLASAIESSAEKIGVPKEERKFSAHITIGRVKSPVGSEKLMPIVAELASADFGV